MLRSGRAPALQTARVLRPNLPNGKVLEYAWVSGARGIHHTDSVGPRKSPPYSPQLTTFDNVFGIYCSTVRNNALVLDSHVAGYKR